MNARPATLAVPGDLDTVTGGYLYDKRLLAGLRNLGHAVQHCALPAGFPDPADDDMTAAFARLEAAAQHGPLIIDGLAFGALDPERVATLQAPILALIHHPLALESGLSAARKAELYAKERTNLRHAAHVIVPSPHTADCLTNDYGVAASDITIARPGTDQPDRPATPATPPLILSVGIQLPRKGHDVLLRALAHLHDLEWRAVIVGAALDADHAAHLAALRTDLGLEERVTLAGQISNAELSGLYRSASLFALATRHEGYGIVFDEALAHGLPILSCATGAVPDTVPKSAGRLVPPEDPPAFGCALRDLLTDTIARNALRTGAQKAGAALPSWANTAQIVSKVLADLRDARS